MSVQWASEKTEGNNRKVTGHIFRPRYFIILFLFVNKTLEGEMFIFLYFWVAMLFCSPSDMLKHSSYGIGSLFTHKAVHFPLSQAHICPKEARDNNAEARVVWPGVQGKRVRGRGYGGTSLPWVHRHGSQPEVLMVHLLSVFRKARFPPSFRASLRRGAESIVDPEFTTRKSPLY